MGSSILGKQTIHKKKKLHKTLQNYIQTQKDLSEQKVHLQTGVPTKKTTVLDLAKEQAQKKAEIQAWILEETEIFLKQCDEQDTDAVDSSDEGPATEWEDSSDESSDDQKKSFSME